MTCAYPAIEAFASFALGAGFYFATAYAAFRFGRWMGYHGHG